MNTILVGLMLVFKPTLWFPMEPQQTLFCFVSLLFVFYSILSFLSLFYGILLIFNIEI